MTPEQIASQNGAPAAASGEGPEELLDQLLRQIITGFFLLADGQGDISKWSDPAELLFGLDGADVIGKPFFSTLIGDPLPAEGESWKGFLEMGEEPQVRARVKLDASHEKVGRFPLEAVFIPVKLDEGFDFSLFLEDLSFELPIDLMLLRMRQQHPVVIRALRASLAEEPQLWEGWRTAGTLVAFRPLVETPWLEEALKQREEQARLAQEEAASRIAMYEAPSVMGDDVRDLEDAAAIVDKLKWASERIEDFEERSRILDKTAADAAAARARAEAAEKMVAEAQEQLTEALTKAGTDHDAGAEAARLELMARLDRIERIAQDAKDGATAQRQVAESAQREAAEAQRARELLAERLVALEDRVGEAADAGRVTAAEQARAEAFAAVEVAREELQARLEVLERSRSETAEQAAQEAREKLAERIESLEQSRAAEASFVRAELERVAAQAAEAAALKDEIAELRKPREDPKLREELSQVRARADEIVAVASEVRRLQGPVADIAGLRTHVEKLERALTEVTAQRAAVEAAAAHTAEQDASIKALREEIASLRSTTADAGELARVRHSAEQALELRAEVEAARARAEEALAATGDVEALEALRADVDSIRARAEAAEAAAAREVPLAPDDRTRLETAQREAEEARAGLEAVRGQSDELRAQAAQLREEAGRLQAQLKALQEGDGQSRHDLDGLRRQHDELKSTLEDARRERDEIRTQLRDALRTAEEAKSAAESRPAEPAGSASMSESGIRKLALASDEYAGLRRDTDALRGRMDELLALAEAAERRAEEARAEAAAARNEGIETRDEAREAQRAAREAGDRVDLVDRGAANVLSEVQAHNAAVEELGAIARAANETAHETRAAAADAAAAVERLETELRGSQQEAVGRVEQAVREHADRSAAQLREELSALREELETTRTKVDASDDADLREALGALRAELDGGDGTPGLRARLDELKTELKSDVPGVRAELEQLRERLDQVAGRAEDASATDALREELAAVRERVQDASAFEALRGDTDSILEQMAALRARLDSDDPAAAVREQVEELRTKLEDRSDVDGLRAELQELRDRPLPEFPDFPAVDPAVVAAAQELPALRRSVDELHAAGFRERLAELHGELKAHRQDNTEGRLVIERRLSEMAADVVTARSEAEQARQTVDALREELSTLREYAASVRAETGAATQTATAARTAVNASDRKFEKLRADVAAMIGSVETWKEEIKEARKAAVAARKDAESAKNAAEKVGAANEANAERFTEVWREILHLKPSQAAQGNGSGVRRGPVRNMFATAPAEPPPKREPREGFDDVAAPIAKLALTGKFTELNPAFTKIVGYQEHEFSRATWPSVHDREVYEQQKQDLAELVTGERECVKVHSTYMHGAGLMVPVVGELTLVRDEAGEPAHLLLVAEDRHNPVA
jgi:PAS domain S-box-containing protein